MQEKAPLRTGVAKCFIVLGCMEMIPASLRKRESAQRVRPSVLPRCLIGDESDG
jgi:hypothetical protein